MKDMLATLTVIAALLAAGCVQKAQPVDQALSATDSIVQDGSRVAANATNDSEAVKHQPPVARMQVFDAGGALAYESDFVAADTAAKLPVRGGGQITLLGGASEAVDPTAKITAWDWTFGDGGKASGRGVTHAFTDLGGVFKLVLKVTDSHALTDTLTVALPVAPTRILNETLAFSGMIQAGTAGAGDAIAGAGGPSPGVDSATHSLEILTADQGYPVAFNGGTITLTTSDPTSDFDLYLMDAKGKVVASSASGPAPGGTEQIKLKAGELANGTYTIRAVLYSGANGSYTIGGNILYIVVNPQVQAIVGSESH